MPQSTYMFYLMLTLKLSSASFYPTLLQLKPKGRAPTTTRRAQDQAHKVLKVEVLKSGTKYVFPPLKSFQEESHE